MFSVTTCESVVNHSKNILFARLVVRNNKSDIFQNPYDGGHEDPIIRDIVYVTWKPRRE